MPGLGEDRTHGFKHPGVGVGVGVRVVLVQGIKVEQ